jgi:hypothetical protein
MQYDMNLNPDRVGWTISEIKSGRSPIWGSLLVGIGVKFADGLIALLNSLYFQREGDSTWVPVIARTFPPHERHAVFTFDVPGGCMSIGPSRVGARGVERQELTPSSRFSQSRFGADRGACFS